VLQAARHLKPLAQHLASHHYYTFTLLLGVQPAHILLWRLNREAYAVACPIIQYCENYFSCSILFDESQHFAFVFSGYTRTDAPTS
jgi:hypothetical protein